MIRLQKWAVCLETLPHQSVNNNQSPLRAKHIRVVQMTKKGEKLGTMTLEQFIDEHGEGRINNPAVKLEVKPKQPVILKDF